MKALPFFLSLVLSSSLLAGASFLGSCEAADNSDQKLPRPSEGPWEGVRSPPHYRLKVDCGWLYLNSGSDSLVFVPDGSCCQANSKP